MHRAALRPAARALSRHATSPASRRLASTSPVDRPRSWKSSALRWGLAGGALYYYSTSSVFAEEPAHLTSSAPSHFSDDDLPTVDSVIEEKRKQIQTRLESRNVVRETKPAPATADADLKAPAATQGNAAQEQQQTATAGADGSVAALEEEAGQQGAFNPETGEINWDCPCLGGMADGPCGEEFKAAFSCFVYSDAEPKGMDCIDKFQHMQDCFRQHPDVYGAELAEDEAAEEAAEQHAAQSADEHAAVKPTSTPDTKAAQPDRQQLREQPASSPPPQKPQQEKKESASTAAAAAPISTPATPEHDPFPTKWDDATAANDAVEMDSPKDKQDKVENNGKA